MRRSDERGIALLLTLLVLTLLVALILEFDAEARREYRDAAAFRDNFKATELAQVNPDLVDAIVDWVDDNEVQEPAGAESLYYQARRPSYKAANNKLQTLLELRLIKGITPEIIEKLSKVVTVFPTEGGKLVN